MVKLVLASKSPRRRELLKMLGVNFEVSDSGVSEKQKDREAPQKYVLRIAKQKAEVAAQKFPNSWILAADTAVVLEGKIIGKPRDGTEAEHILSALSGKWHTVLTGVVLAGASGRRSLARVVSSKVKFRRLAPQEMRAYVETCEPMDKAGAYGIQGKGASLVEKVSGSYTNVIGLPVKETREMLKAAGIL